MKKQCIFFALFFMVIASFFAQEAPTQTLDIETSSVKKGHYTINIEYTPLLREARLSCSAPTSFFDEADAINTTMNTLREFAAEKRIGKYEHYVKPVIRNDNAKKITSYIVSVIFKPL